MTVIDKCMLYRVIDIADYTVCKVESEFLRFRLWKRNLKNSDSIKRKSGLRKNGFDCLSIFCRRKCENTNK